MQIAAITFHGAHNFGSVLQTYALQRYVEELSPDICYTILNYRSRLQREIYAVTKKNNNIKNIAKNILRAPYKKQWEIKQEKFERFSKDYLHTTLESDVIPEEWKDYDFYISGSDQIWNVRAKDFSNHYFLDFVDRGKKISYAASFGPLAIDWQQYDAEKYAELLRRYDALSVREVGSQENVRLLTGKDCKVHVDPTLLLTVEEWREIQSDVNYNNGQYILFYCLEPSRQQMRVAKAASDKFGLPVIILRQNNKNDLFNGFVKKYDSGPRDFLAYIDHAALVLTSSFHGTAFSLLYHKPFYVLNSKVDRRISNILDSMGLVERYIKNEEEVQKVVLTHPDAVKIERYLEAERICSRDYLQEVLGLEKTV